MPTEIKSKAQLRRFQTLLEEGKITQAAFDRAIENLDIKKLA